MSPEQCAGTAVDHRSDIYSFGCMLFQALTGSTPFEGNTSIETMMHHRDKAPRTLRKASGGKDFPTELEALVARLLAKKPDVRPSSFDDVSAQLKEACKQSAPYVVPKIVDAEKKPSSPLSLKKRLLWVGGIAGFLIAGTALCLTAIDFVVPTRESPTIPTAQFGSPFDVSNKEIIKQPYKVHYYSRVIENNGAKKKLFTFPKGKFLGELYILNAPSYNRQEGWLAKGTVELPYDKPIGLRALSDSIKDTRMLRNFRKSDLHEVLF
jgi:Protein kinase domain.